MTSIREYIDLQKLENVMAEEMFVKMDELINIRNSMAKDVAELDKEINKLFMDMKDVGVDIKEYF